MPSITLAEPSPQPAQPIERPERKVDPSLLAKSAGKLRINIWLSEASRETIDQLKALGVEITSTEQAGKLLIGAVDRGKLLEVAKLASVRYIAPRT